jgi:hypothetical protein
MSKLHRSLALAVTLWLPAETMPQPITYEAVRLGEILVESGWSSLKAALPFLASGLSAQLRVAGVSEQAASALSREFSRAMTRESVGKAYALLISQQLTPDEARDLAAFLQTALGKKYLHMDLASNRSVVKPILRSICDSAIASLAAPEARELRGACAGL